VLSSATVIASKVCFFDFYVLSSNSNPINFFNIKITAIEYELICRYIGH